MKNWKDAEKFIVAFINFRYDVTAVVM